jgi:hypothetical protein
MDDGVNVLGGVLHYVEMSDVRAHGLDLLAGLGLGQRSNVKQSKNTSWSSHQGSQHCPDCASRAGDEDAFTHKLILRARPPRDHDDVSIAVAVSSSPPIAAALWPVGTSK